MRCMIYEKNMSSLTLHDPDQRHGIPPPRVTVIMHHSGANAFKAAALLQLTPDSSLHLLFHTRQFSKASPDGCRFEAKWKLDSVGPVLKLISACCVCRTAVWKPRNKVRGSWSHLSDKSGGKNTCCTEFFSLFFFLSSDRQQKHPGWLLRSHLFHFNISHTFRGHRGRVKSSH